MTVFQFALAYGAGALSVVLGIIAYAVLFGSIVVTREEGFPQSRKRRK